jgi:hypothetical protein
VKCPVLHGHIPEELLDARFHYWQRCGKKGVMGKKSKLQERPFWAAGGENFMSSF